MMVVTILGILVGSYLVGMAAFLIAWAVTGRAVQTTKKPRELPEFTDARDAVRWGELRAMADWSPGAQPGLRCPVTTSDGVRCIRAAFHDEPLHLGRLKNGDGLNWDPFQMSGVGRCAAGCFEPCGPCLRAVERYGRHDALPATLPPRPECPDCEWDAVMTMSGPVVWVQASACPVHAEGGVELIRPPEHP